MTAFSNLSSEEWAALLAAPDSSLSRYGEVLPDLPSEDVQIATAGKSGFPTMAEASDFYHKAKAAYQATGRRIETAKVLDFGCGWGRVTRTFLKDVPAENVFGADVRPDILKLAHSLAPQIRFVLISNSPPLSIFDQFDIITAYSVFSHLPQAIADAWINDFYYRIPAGGLLVITTRSRKHIESGARMAESADSASRNHPYGRMFSDFGAALAAYDRGDFVYSGTGGGAALPADVYGEAFIPAAYVRGRWGDRFKLLEYVEGYSKYAAQPAIVLQRR